MQPIQLKMARGALDMTVAQLASKVGLPEGDIARFESGETDDQAMRSRLTAVLEESGIMLIGEDGVRCTHLPNAGTIPLEDLNSANDE